MKKIIYFVLMVSILFSYTSIYAYDYIDKNNESSVKSQKKDIYERKKMYEELAGEKSEDEETLDYTNVSSNQMWWPIGSKETTTSNGKTFAKGNPTSTIITSPFGYRNQPTAGASKNHNGIDISGAGIAGNPVIASLDGTVEQAQFNSIRGYYVLIKHNDGTKTRYQHMQNNSITVKTGDVVKQGQVIGKVGSTGVSTGDHLHFEVIVNGNPVDPTKYVDLKNPRPAGNNDLFLNTLKNAEIGDEPTYCGSDKKYYKVHNVNNETYNTAGYGVNLNPDHVKAIKKYGGDSSKTNDGDCLLVTAVDSVMLEVATARRNEVQSMARSNSITLKQHEEDALVIHLYQTGNGNLAGTKEFAKIYKSMTKPQDLGEFFMGSHSAEGVRKRRCYIWKLYYKGIYFADKSPFNDSESVACSNLY